MAELNIHKHITADITTPYTIVLNLLRTEGSIPRLRDTSSSDISSFHFHPWFFILWLFHPRIFHPQHFHPRTFILTLSSSHFHPCTFHPRTFILALSSSHFHPRTFILTLSSSHFHPRTFIFALSSSHFHPTIVRTQMLEPKYLDVNMVTNVHLLTKSTVGTSEHSFKSVDEGR